MVKKRTNKPAKLVKIDRFAPIEKELRKSTKADLAALILVIAKEHDVVARELEDHLAIEKPMDLLVADVSSAIDRATDFDERDMNRNFDVDWQAYADVQKGLSLLVEQGHLEEAKSLALKLMKDGSYQVECSDEGMMSDEISECLKPVIRAVKAAGGDESVEYHYGSFRGDVDGLLQRGYDVYLQFTNYGNREIKLRLPRGMPFAKGKNPDHWLGESQRLVTAGGTDNYKAAAEILHDLREAIGGEKGDKIARRSAAKLAKKHPTLNHLKSSLRKRGLLK